MNKTNPYRDFAAIESHIRRARLERSMVLGNMLANGVDATLRGLRALKASLEANFRVVMHRTIPSDALARRSVPRY